MLGSISSSRCQITRAPAAKAGRRANWFLTNELSALVGVTRSKTSGGARRDRTDDLLLAKQALSQLSYGPFRRQSTDRSKIKRSVVCRLILAARAFTVGRLVGLGRFELPTSRLSSARSNQLSYKPMPGIDNWPGSFAKKEKRRRRRPANGRHRV